MEIDCHEFIFSEKDYVLAPINVGSNAKTRFDILLQKKWNEAVEAGCCRYKLTNLKTKIIPGQHQFVAQLNVERAQLRRKPQDLQLVNTQFKPEEFNFTRVPQKEVLFSLRHEDEKPSQRNVVIINVSPLEYCNSLLVPQLNGCVPQRVTLEGLRLLLQVMLLSSNGNLRAGFNSPGGYASVNHQHFHLYYLSQPLTLESVQVEHLTGSCYTLTKFPSTGYAFQLTRTEDLDLIARDIFKVVSYMRENEVAHNMFLTKGSSFEDTSIPALRIYIWAREPSFGVKDDVGFNPALCELSGHLLIKEPETFETAHEEQVAALLSGITRHHFERLLPAVQRVLS